MNYLKVESTDEIAIKELSDMAAKIVKEHFDPIIGAAQNDYMINRFQSVSAISEQLDNGCQYFFVSDSAGNKVGFLGFYLRESYIYLSKFYLQKKQRGKGISKDMLNFIVKKAREEGLTSIVLNVNKNNDAVTAYEKLGFVKIGEEKTDIGDGFFMDDVVYEYLVE